MARQNEVRISPTGDAVAWCGPESDDDGQPWLVVQFAPQVDWDWYDDAYVAGWTTANAVDRRQVPLFTATARPQQE